MDKSKANERTESIHGVEVTFKHKTRIEVGVLTLEHLARVSRPEGTEDPAGSSREGQLDV